MLGDTNRSLRIFTWLGIPVYLHWSFFLIFLYALYIGYSEEMATSSILWLMGFFVAMFACVLLHEFGHSIAARRYGVVTHDIILTPLGGMARLARIPEKPIQEFIVAIAGPLVNVLIALVLYAFGKFFFRNEAQSLFSYFLAEPNMEMQGLYMFIPLMIWTNVSLFVFNLLPAFPMDGGRILRSLLSMQFGRLRATKYATWLGQVLAVLFILFGLYNENFVLALIGVFVITTARAEYRQVRNSAMLRNHTARDLVRHQFTRFYINDWVQSAHDLLAHGHERAFLVYDLQQHPLGVIGESEILKAKAANQLASPIGNWMQTRIPATSINTGVEEIQNYLNHPEIDLVAIQDPQTHEILGVIDDLSLEFFIERQERTLE
jgi:Zn-dependent protease